MMISKHFQIEEFVPKEIFDQFGAKSVWWIRPEIIYIAEFIRNKTNQPVTVNNWHVGGEYNNSGYRTPQCTIGAKYSQHRLANAADFKIKTYTAEEMRQFVRDNFVELNKLGLTTIEDNTPTWLHADCRWTGSTALLEVPFQ